jgi:hypothetical protein
MAGSAREEAERLVVTFLARAAAGGLGAAASAASSDSGGTGKGPDPVKLLGESVAGLAGMLHSSAGWATGSPECCVCPVCRVITAVRDPSPETAERLATSAGEIATGVAGLMRAFSSLAGEKPRPAPAPRSPGQRPANPDTVWSKATRDDEPGGSHLGDESGTSDLPVGGDPWAAASAEDARTAAREAAAAAKARAAAAEEAVARAVAAATAARAESARRQAARTGVGSGVEGERVTRTSDVWASAIAQAEAAAEVEVEVEVAALARDVAEAEATSGGGDGHRSVDHVLGAEAPEDRDGAGPGDGARRGDAV